MELWDNIVLFTKETSSFLVQLKERILYSFNETALETRF